MRSSTRPRRATGTILSLALASAAIATGAQAATITIVTRSTAGYGINVTIERRTNGGTWTAVHGARTADGRMSATEPVCNSTVEYRAVDQYGMYIRSADIAVPCQEPEVVFNDFVPVFYDAWKADSNLGRAENWTLALGADPAAAAKAQEAAAAVEAARSQGAYGQVAVMATELAAQLLAAGNGKSAAYMRALAIDATTRGVLKAQGDPADTVQSLTPDPYGNLVLSPDAKEKIAAYQVDVLGAKPNSQKLGKIDWKTMRSLEGGTATAAADWKLSSEALASFDFSALTGG